MNQKSMLTCALAFLVCLLSSCTISKDVSSASPSQLRVTWISSDFKADLREAEVQEVLKAATLSQEQATALASDARAFFGEKGGCIIKDASGYPFAVLLTQANYIDIAYGPSGDQGFLINSSNIRATGSAIEAGEKNARAVLDRAFKGATATGIWRGLER